MIEVIVHNEKLVITDETILAVRQKIATRKQDEYGSILNNTNRWVEQFPFMKSEQYLNELLEGIKSVLNGDEDKYLVFIQECLYYQTGKSVPLLG